MTAVTARQVSGRHASVPPPPVRRRGWWPDLLGAVTWLSMLVVVALWVGHHGVQDLGSLGSELTSVGRLTGLVAADLLLIQVFLMARVPVVERTYGQDRLARWHRVVGFTSVNLMLAHIAFVLLGYTVTARTGLLSETWDVITTYPGMLLATGGTAALVLVVVTSLRAARRRLRYESWHLLHLYAYLGVGLALPHELWTGTEFVSSPAATVYWWTAYGVAAGSVLVFRLGLPAWRSLRHRIRVHGVVPEAPGVWSVYLAGRRLDRLPVRAGQFLNWRFLAGPGWTRAHPYSLSARPPSATLASRSPVTFGRPDMLRITVKELGDESRLVSRLRPGTRVLIEGPYGGMTGAARRTPRMTLLACGIGITPLRALLEEQAYAPGEATLLYRARSADDLALRGELEAIAAHRGVRVGYLLGPRGAHGSWLPEGYDRGDRALRRMVPDIAAHDVFICGPDEWMSAAAESVRRAGVPDAQLHIEHFSW
ncbi:MAG TPA: ferredoxin reductase family protein [Rugosimonospora sp.]|nr:ferredoxin reductase family protein [Rugosimonospora sp.]